MDNEEELAPIVILCNRQYYNRLGNMPPGESMHFLDCDIWPWQRDSNTKASFDPRAPLFIEPEPAPDVPRWRAGLPFASTRGPIWGNVVGIGYSVVIVIVLVIVANLVERLFQ